jgi:hypothetical protein
MSDIVAREPTRSSTTLEVPLKAGIYRLFSLNFPVEMPYPTPITTPMKMIHNIAWHFQPGFLFARRRRGVVVAVVRCGCSGPDVAIDLRAEIRAARWERRVFPRVDAGAICGDSVLDGGSRKGFGPRWARLEGLGGSVTGMWVLGI